MARGAEPGKRRGEVLHRAALGGLILDPAAAEVFPAADADIAAAAFVGQVQDVDHAPVDLLAPVPVKPADADDVERALLADPNKKAAPPENPMSADRVKWEHIHRVFELCNRNVSETARRLKMHRRTLQRILSKRSPK